MMVVPTLILVTNKNISFDGMRFILNGWSSSLCCYYYYVATVELWHRTQQLQWCEKRRLFYHIMAMGRWMKPGRQPVKDADKRCGRSIPISSSLPSPINKITKVSWRRRQRYLLVLNGDGSRGRNRKVWLLSAMYHFGLRKVPTTQRSNMATF